MNWMSFYSKFLCFAWQSWKPQPGSERCNHRTCSCGGWKHYCLLRYVSHLLFVLGLFLILKETPSKDESWPENYSANRGGGGGAVLVPLTTQSCRWGGGAGLVSLTTQPWSRGGGSTSAINYSVMQGGVAVLVSLTIQPWGGGGGGGKVLVPLTTQPRGAGGGSASVFNHSLVAFYLLELPNTQSLQCLV